jgi:demethylspheroidene O-methyltransferase
MTDLPLPARPPFRALPRAGWFARLVARPGFQRWAAAFPLTRRVVRAEGAALFDLVAGFCHSQVLLALVSLDVPARLLGGPVDEDDLARACEVPPERMRVLLRAGAAIGLLRLRRRRVGLTRRGAALAGVPGLREMILHHDVLYRDLTDPVAFFRGETQPELARYWPYVLGAGAAADPASAARYSTLMAGSLVLVAEDTLAIAPLGEVDTLMDVGGGTGAFLVAACRAHPRLKGILLDLPAVLPGAAQRLEAAGLKGRVRLAPGSFRDTPLPTGADAISLVRVLYDHADATVSDLLAACHAALPPGGRLIVSEPMTGGDRPARAGDAYFALYTMAMGTGRARSPEEIATMLAQAGFDAIRQHPSRRPFVTSVISARRI